MDRTKTGRLLCELQFLHLENERTAFDDQNNLFQTLIEQPVPVVPNMSLDARDISENISSHQGFLSDGKKIGLARWLSRQTCLLPSLTTRVLICGNVEVGGKRTPPSVRCPPTLCICSTAYISRISGIPRSLVPSPSPRITGVHHPVKLFIKSWRSGLRP